MHGSGFSPYYLSTLPICSACTPCDVICSCACFSCNLFFPSFHRLQLCSKKLLSSRLGRHLRLLSIPIVPKPDSTSRTMAAHAIPMEKQQVLTGSNASPSLTSNERVVDRAAERRLVRKLDLRIIPVLWILYLCNFIDRANVSTALRVVVVPG